MIPLGKASTNLPNSPTGFVPSRTRNSLSHNSGDVNRQSTAEPILR